MRGSRLVHSLVAVVILFASSWSALSLASTDHQGGTRKAPQGFYVYHGNYVPLHLRQNELGVRCPTQLSASEVILHASQAGVAITSAFSAGIDGWYVLVLTDPLVDSIDADTRLTRLASSPSFDFATPSFATPWDGRILVTPGLLLRLEASQIPNVRPLLEAVEPGLQILESEHGGMAGVYRISTLSENGYDVLAVANQLAVTQGVRWAEPEVYFSVRPALIPNDPGFDWLWGIRNTGQFGGVPDMDMDGDLAWEVTTGSPQVPLLVIDVGVQQNHPDLNQLPGADFTGQGSGGGPWNECDNHGTAVAGCISGIIDNAIGTVGIAPDCPVVSARVFISNVPCDGGWTSNQTWTVNALNWGRGQGCLITNNSNEYGFQSNDIDDAYEATYAAGMLHFAATGNLGVNQISYPASIPVVNAVTAIEPGGERASFGNYGVGLDFSSPGVTIYTTDRTGMQGYDQGDYTFSDGTSFASPYAAGVAALVWSRNLGLTNTQVEGILQTSCRDLGQSGYDTETGWGLVNAYRGVSLAESGRWWVEVSPGGEPPTPRANRFPVFDTATGRMLLFGGAGNEGLLNDTWELSLAGYPVWEELQPSGALPAGRDGSSAVYDPVGQRMVVFGGHDGSTYRSDTWALGITDEPTWVQLQPSGAPPLGRYFHTAVYDPVRERMILFGGGGASGYFNDTWELALSGDPAWAQLFPSGTAPPARGWCSSIYDPLRDRIIIFGGYPRTNDTWELALSPSPAWLQLSPASPPSARSGHGALYDRAWDRMLIFGGSTGPNAFLNDVWVLPLWSGLGWVQIVPAGTPPSPRDKGGFVFDELNDQMIVFGGIGPSGYLNDTWALGWGGAASVEPIEMSDSPVVPVARSYPNPFEESTTITLDLAEQSLIDLRVIDVSGRLVRRILDGESVGPGRTSVSWDGRSTSGQAVASGMYFYQIEGHGWSALRRVMVVR